MRIRVAYDITFLANSFSYPEGQSGVHRTVEELLFALCERDDITLTAIAACGEDPLLDVTNSSRYLLNRKDKVTCHFEPSLVGHSKLSAIYFRSFGGNAKANIPGSVPGRRSVNYERARHQFARFVRKVDRPRLVFDRSRYDVFHSPFLRLPSRAVVEEIPRVLTIYDLIFLKNPEFMTPGLVNFLQKIFDSLDINRDWVTCISEFTKAELCDFTGIAPERVFVTPLAAAAHFHPVTDLERITEARQKYGIPESNYFLALSHLQPRKNFAHLIRCFLRLLSEHPGLDVNLVIVGGSGWLDDEIFAASGSTEELKRRVIFTGYVPNPDLSAIYSGATAFLFPSLYEGFGLPALEAMQCGLPVVASNTTAFPEVIGDAGLLVNPTDADSLCQAMLDLLSSEARRRELSERGLVRSKNFSWANCAERTVAAYQIAADS